MSLFKIVGSLKSDRTTSLLKYLHLPELLFKSIVPIVMAGILGIYGLIIAVLFNGDIKKTEFDQLVKLGTDPKGGNYSAYKGFQQLGAGLCCGMSSLAAGLAIGVVGDAAVRANA